jgi:hypothetical protein
VCTNSVGILRGFLPAPFCSASGTLGLHDMSRRKFSLCHPGKQQE